MQKATNSTKEDEIRDITLLETDIMNMWAQGLSPKQIAEATRQPIKIIYQLLMQKQMEILKDEGVTNHGEKNDT